MNIPAVSRGLCNRGAIQYRSYKCRIYLRSGAPPALFGRSLGTLERTRVVQHSDARVGISNHRFLPPIASERRWRRVEIAQLMQTIKLQTHSTNFSYCATCKDDTAPTGCPADAVFVDLSSSGACESITGHLLRTMQHVRVPQCGVRR